MNSIRRILPVAWFIAVSAIAADTGDYNMPSQEAQKASAPTGVVNYAVADAQAVETAFGAADFLVFTESREAPVRRFDAIPQRWLDRKSDASRTAFNGKAQPGEFYVFQLAVYAMKSDTGRLALEPADLKSSGGKLPADSVHCFNLGGIDANGHAFTKNVAVPKGRLQPLWVGLPIPTDAKGSYSGTWTLRVGDHSVAIPVAIEVSGPMVPEHGDLDSWRLSRLRWLDSTLGLDDDMVVKPFEPIEVNGKTLHLLGRDLELSPDGLPAAV